MKWHTFLSLPQCNNSGTMLTQSVHCFSQLIYVARAVSQKQYILKHPRGGITGQVVESKEESKSDNKSDCKYKIVSANLKKKNERESIHRHKARGNNVPVSVIKRLAVTFLLA